MNPKALFASDIDHTLTAANHIIPDCVIETLTDLYKSGFEIMLVTGRTLSFAQNSVNKLPFPFFIGLQNGAEILEMPEKHLFQSRLLPKSFAIELQAMTKALPGDFIVYGGSLHTDICYYKRDKFDQTRLDHILNFSLIASGIWKEVKDFQEIEQKEVPMIKYMGPLKVLEKIREEIAKKFPYNVCLMKDAIDRTAWILLITHEEANKGLALRRVFEKKGWTCPIIASGDDNNDIPLLAEADIKIAMADGSDLLIEKADIVAKPSKEFGIIEALEKAKRRLGL